MRATALCSARTRVAQWVTMRAKVKDKKTAADAQRAQQANPAPMTQQPATKGTQATPMKRGHVCARCFPGHAPIAHPKRRGTS